jgi:hypothetical protein
LRSDLKIKRGNRVTQQVQCSDCESDSNTKFRESIS